MTQFNIQGSKIEQLSDKGNNYKVTSETGNIAFAEKGNAVLTEGTQNRVQVDRPKDNLVSMLWAKLKRLWAWAFG